MSMRSIFTPEISSVATFKQQLLQWAQAHTEVLVLDSNSHVDPHSNFDLLVAVDAFTSLKTDESNAFQELHNYQQATQDWILGYLTYDLKNNVENLQSHNFDGLEFPELYFFQPKKLFLFRGENLEMQYLKLCDDEMASDVAVISQLEIEQSAKANDLHIDARISRESYLSKVNKMKEYIQQGDIYEANFCMEFYAEQAHIHPLQTYNQLNSISQAPFSVFYKNKAQYLLCASPERYLQKTGTRVISQPIKGTAKRSPDLAVDEQIKQVLATDAKERAENIMIADLVRNDLSKTAIPNSVIVEELCGIYSFKQVHQMITTIASEVPENCPPVDLLKTTFPMGSMTGAPKLSAMQIIEELEETKRGLYSSSVGYFTPNGDFDFNVVIRSILYNAANNYVSFSVGSAITSLAQAEQEYDECLLKAKAMRAVLQ
jgi:para-aminobenzoate synthetase component 1